MKNYIETSFPNHKFIDDAAFYKRSSAPTKEKLNNLMEQPGDKEQGISPSEVWEEGNGRLRRVQEF